MSKEKKELTLPGTEITGMHTINSMYANGFVKVLVGTKEYRIHTSTILQMVNEFTFTLERKRTYYHLEEPKLKR